MLMLLPSAGSSAPMIATTLSVHGSHHASVSHHPHTASVLAATLHVLIDRTFFFTLVMAQERRCLALHLNLSKQTGRF